MYIRRVVGNSMMPRLKPGDIVFALKLNFKVNDVVLFRASGRNLIKRVSSINNRGVYLLGDNPDFSTDSRQYGYITKNAIMGKIIMNLRFADSTQPPLLKNRAYLLITYSVAIVLVAILLFQLYNFELFVPYVATAFGWGSDELKAKLFTSVFVLLELAAVPFLLRLRLSPAMRSLSAGSLILVPLVGIVLDYLAYVNGSLGITAGFYNLLKTLIIAPLAIWSFFILGGPRVFKRLNKY